MFLWLSPGQYTTITGIIDKGRASAYVGAPSRVSFRREIVNTVVH